MSLEDRLRHRLQQAFREGAREISLANMSLEMFPGAEDVLPEDVQPPADQSASASTSSTSNGTAQDADAAGELNPEPAKNVSKLAEEISNDEDGHSVDCILPKGMETPVVKITPRECSLRPLMIHLESIDLSNNDLTYMSFPSPSLPSAVACLPSLHTLILRNNTLDRLPPFIPKLPSLRTLRLDLNSLQTLKGFHQMTSLTELNVLMNEIEGYVKQLAALTNLQVLILSTNHITRLPKLARLSNLQVLHVGDNKLGTGKQRPKRRDTPSQPPEQSPTLSRANMPSEFERLLSKLPHQSLTELVLGALIVNDEGECCADDWTSEGGNLLGPQIPHCIGTVF
jgi:Leucine-rich repeat (LRR) protein